MKRSVLITALALGALPAFASAQGRASHVGAFEAALGTWRAEHGASWRVDVRARSGRLEMLYGGNARGPLQPESDAQWFSLARHFLAETAGFHSLSGASFVDERVVFLPLGQVNTTDKYSVQLRQEVRGVPVEDAGVSLIFDTTGRLLALHTTAIQGLAGEGVQPALSAAAAQRGAIEHFTRAHGAPTEVGSASLVFARTNGGEEGRLAWTFELFQREQDTRPVGFAYEIDAQSGAVLETEVRVHDFDVRGTVMMNATPGLTPDTAGNPPGMVPVPFARITSATQGVVFADENGDFVYPGINTALDVTAEFVGTFNDVIDDLGNDHVVMQNLPANQNNTVLLNPAPTETITSQANCYNGVMATRDFVRATTPTDATADFIVTSNANLSATCNAFFDGVSINFFLAGGGCENTAFSTVVTHELGHWLNVLYGTGNNSSGMGEGNADVFAMYTFDTPVLGDGFCGAGCNVRNGTNTRQWCGTGCYGQVHADGEVWMGAAWKIRRNLNTTHGNAMGDMIADTLFMNWMNGFDQADIAPIIETQWLTLDDNDGNLLNGTPNVIDIDMAFREQGFPGADIFVDVTNVTQLADTLNEAGPYAVTATISAGVFPPVTSTELHYRVDGGALLTLPMTSIGGDDYQAMIPGIPSPARVEYFVEGSDSMGLGKMVPADPNDGLPFRVGVVTVVQNTAFESGPDGWLTGDPADTATTGMWELGDPLGTGAQPEDDHSVGGINTWFTGQGTPGGGLGENDVDGGVTTLYSSIFDLSGLTNAQVRYWRWYSNNTGAEPGADIFEVDISNDGGASWTPVEVVGPGGAGTTGGWVKVAVDVASFVLPTANVQLRFRASDLAGGSIVEAAIDDILTDDVGPVNGGCGSPMNYCMGGINSVGSSASISMAGSQSVGANAFGLSVVGAPASKAGLFRYSMGQAMTPFGDGFQCLGSPTFDLMPIVRTGVAGTFTRTIDVNNPPSPAGQITAGSTWNFQFIYRDRTGPGGSGFNLSDAVAVPFCP